MGQLGTVLVRLYICLFVAISSSSPRPTPLSEHVRAGVGVSEPARDRARVGEGVDSRGWERTSIALALRVRGLPDPGYSMRSVGAFIIPR